MKGADYILNTANGPLHITVFKANCNVQRTIIFGSAMGVKRRFYSKIAHFFNERRFNCVTFDYSGMFHEDEPLGNKDIGSFGKNDLSEVISYCKTILQSKHIFFVGHSIAGQILPLARNANKLTASYLVASQSVCSHLWKGKNKSIVNLFWNILTPLALKLIGYMPSYFYGGKNNLSKAIASDWARLAKTKHGVYGEGSNSLKYLTYDVPTKFVSIKGDDLLAPRKAVEDLFDKYGTNIKVHEHISNTEDTLDHFNFFQVRNRILWEDIQSWFEDFVSDDAQQILNSYRNFMQVP
ncbi:hypothetical protein [Fulvivirga lutea]|uniref:Alpha/beta hydrolase n=1 Tax=Fulvivirga lutea TaxID=2810512 RepID=A0A974WH98_9BACT|nr:hypothetical protein [Fulvivirga lutea]QSE97849.1 hypothetical protein JR347_01810 [Fulvivirga lutea]